MSEQHIAKDVVSNVDAAKKDSPKETFAFYTRASLYSTIHMQNAQIKELKRDKFRFFFSTIFFVIVSTILFLKPAPEPRYFGQDEHGNFTEIQALSKPIDNLIAMRTWTQDCMTDSLELSFINPVKRLNEILGKCFDTDGQRAYQAWLFTGNPNGPKIEVGRAGEIPADSEMGVIIRKRQALSASPLAPSRIVPVKDYIDEETNEKVAQWEVTMPLIVKKEVGSDSSGIGRVVVKVIIRRTTDKGFPKGVAINTWTIAPDA